TCARRTHWGYSTEHMIPALIALLFQFYFNRPILENEDARAEQPSAIIAALNSTDPQVQRLAVRAIGRLERVQLADSMRTLLASPDAGVRMETVNALGQMNAPFDVTGALDQEKDASVRAVIFETAGRLRESPPEIQGILLKGLTDTPAARVGAAKGLEWF